MVVRQFVKPQSRRSSSLTDAWLVHWFRLPFIPFLFFFFALSACYSRSAMESDPPPDPVDLSRTGTEDCPAAETSAPGCESAAGSVEEAAESSPASVVPESRKRCLWRRGGAAAVSWGSASTVGRRREMEDAVAVAPGFLDLTCEQVGGCSALPALGEISTVRFFGVYDGHGGSQVANFCAKRVHEAVAEEWNKIQGPECWKRRWETAFHNGFGRVDNEVIDEAVAPDMVGSTAVVVVLSGCQIIASNCGDSRAILCRGSQRIQLTIDHKPDREDELMRIESLGGRVINWQGPRVSGFLSVSRSIGDRFLRPWVIPVPEVSFMPRNEGDDCLILASDGLWDVMSTEEVGDVACRLLRWHRRNGLVDGASPAQAVADHLTELAYQKNSSDNISVVVVDLKSRSRRRPRQ